MTHKPAYLHLLDKERGVFIKKRLSLQTQQPLWAIISRMRTTKYYNIAGHLLQLTADHATFSQLCNCQPFEVDATESGLKKDHREVLLQTEVIHHQSMPEGWKEECRQTEEGDEIACGFVGDQPAFRFFSHGLSAGWLVCSPDYRHATIATESLPQLALNNGMMVSYALATANRGTLLFHSSVVSRNQRAYMFLGPSGTGKSTHTQLWLQHIEGSRLLNDDNPIVRIDSQGHAHVYGSPWSGKTPCYRNEHYPLGGIVRLSQAPYNAIRRMNPLESYATLLSSISGKRWDRDIADGLHESLNTLVTLSSVWYMECLPDKAAAIMTSETI